MLLPCHKRLGDGSRSQGGIHGSFDRRDVLIPRGIEYSSNGRDGSAGGGGTSIVNDPVASMIHELVPIRLDKSLRKGFSLTGAAPFGGSWEDGGSFGSLAVPVQSVVDARGCFGAKPMEKYRIWDAKSPRNDGQV